MRTATTRHPHCVLDTSQVACCRIEEVHIKKEPKMTLRPNLVTFSIPCDDIDVAADFYRRLLGKEPEEPAPGNVEFELAEGT